MNSGRSAPILHSLCTKETSHQAGSVSSVTWEIIQLRKKSISFFQTSHRLSYRGAKFMGSPLDHLLLCGEAFTFFLPCLKPGVITRITSCQSLFSLLPRRKGLFVNVPDPLIILIHSCVLSKWGRLPVRPII